MNHVNRTSAAFSIRIGRALSATVLSLISTFAAIGVSFADEPANENEAERPNIVFIFADDLGWTDLGCYGSEYYETPHIDRLCRQGMKFTSAYTNGPNCAPTRACLLSGQYGPRHGVYTVGTGERGREQYRKLIPPPNRTDLPLETVTLAETLQAAGYVTAHMGKWHLGSGANGPTGQGFDVNIAGNQAGAPRSYFSPYRNPDLSNGPAGEYLTDRLTAEAIKFIEANRERPFFLYLSHYAVHTPLQAKPELIEKYKRKGRKGGHNNPTYAAMIESLDESVGRILDALEELKLAERTLVIFYSDNGGLGGYRAAGVPGGQNVTDNAPLRGGKGMLYEGGIRVPLIVRLPGLVAPGSTCDEPIVTLDFYPTLAELAGAPHDPNYVLDGVSFVSLLKSAGQASLGREAVYWHFPGYLQANANRGTWRTTPAGAIRSGDYKLIEFFEDRRVELYDLKDDLQESQNLAAELPERTAQLRERLHHWRTELNAPMPTPNLNYNPDKSE
jgi:arylsulfatase A-like enzyme